MVDVVDKVPVFKRASGRRGAGRPKGRGRNKKSSVVPALDASTVSRTRAPADFRNGMAARSYNSDGGVVPLQVMIENMRFAHSAATDLLVTIKAMMADGVTSTVRIGADGVEIVDSILDVYKAMMRMRNVAQGYAVEAAPYMHPKLAQVEIRGDESSPIYVTEVRRVVIDAVAISNN